MDPERDQSEKIAILVATFNRLDCLKRLLAGVPLATTRPWTAVIADNAADRSVEDFVASLGNGSRYLRLPGNLGCARGLFECEAAIANRTDLSHVLIVDDDCEFLPGAIDALLAALENHSTNIVVPLIEDDRGRVTSIAGPLPEPAWSAIKKTPPATEFAAAFSNQILPASWFPGVCLAFPFDRLAALGLHDPAYWMMGEDLDFSLRYSLQSPALMVVAARARHLPPVRVGLGEKPSDFAYAKETAMILNTLYLIFHTRHGKRLLRHLPGNVLRWIQQFHSDRPWLRDLAWCVHQAITNGRRAGDPEFQKRFLSLDRSTSLSPA